MVTSPPPHRRGIRLWVVDPLRAGYRNDGRHGVARHYAPQQQMLLRTGHRPFSRDFELTLSDRAMTRAVGRPLIGSFRLRSPRSPWSGGAGPTTGMFSIRDHGRAFVVGGLAGAVGFPHRQLMPSVERPALDSGRTRAERKFPCPAPLRGHAFPLCRPARPRP
ncbi:predicted protein [Streptomyces viridosporus ATCC 14672]|uniref:Predicted protein n=1 Tax=Streptomyces viridosporus (strain ATCC 14672 / DSM 40746 / JCM 4963 / KCTC 9882 / NRRL B-12104 / FH 1290) TaxID=566461 RepID=D5ZQE3_STRV1|nr:predicted protein [Streptomyces viridosporus ATCC 14672]